MLISWRQKCLGLIIQSLRKSTAGCSTRHSLFSSSNLLQKSSIDTSHFPCDLIRNFCIIAHIDHGKSTLADRMLELTGTISLQTAGLNPQILDKLKVERERGITVKAQTASMLHPINGVTYLLNLIDTPGHVDFAWEVSRSMAACEGAILLVDATQGVQAQTLSVFHIARDKGLKIVPVLNKIDLQTADPQRSIAQMRAIFDIDPADIFQVSAKSGMGVSNVLEAIVSRVPSPKGSLHQPLKAVLFDSSYDQYRGVVSLIRMLDGTLRKGDKIASSYTGKKYDIIEVGVMYPEEESTATLQAGQVGYISCNMKDSKEAHVGDTLHRAGEKVDAVAGLQLMKPTVYAGIYPVEANDFLNLEESIKRLTLTDRSVVVQRESSTALGQGCRLGFLGTLHMDVFRQRLEDEYNENVIITAPTVPYKIVYRDNVKLISNPTEFPELGEAGGAFHVEEPMVKATIIVPEEYVGEMMELCSVHRVQDLEHHYIDSGADAESSRILLTCELPLSEIMSDFYAKLKSRSSGFASFDYEDAGYQKADMAKITFLLNARPVDALALIVHRSQQDQVARDWVKKLHKVIPRQQFEVPIQAVIGKRVLARANLAPYRKDVTAGLYGGHHERKLKHLNIQKEGKKKLKRIGQVDLPQEAFFDLLGSKSEK